MPALTPRSAPKWLTDPAVSVLSRLGVTPNMLTLFGFAGNVGAAVLAANGRFLEAGVVMLAFSALDFLDGSLARATGRATPFGSVLDSTMDRLSEAAVLFGLLWYFSGLNAREEELLIFAAVVASIMVSYLRARAEIIGVKLREGIFTRTERVLLLGGGLILQDILDTNVLTPVLWALALIAGFTVLQRLVFVWLKTKDMSDSA
ncbi:MAG: CDP-alcohol phosphatidyltransferase family protein [Chloroflexi bacterium]|nr:CDP-alcohol phosphatidyltransferase family protein [Chloroflexota bacterium]MCI0817653.1 CDP-alcohol phosphatidyltransferase family protein [Chloroflexota bacterium]MCI0831980.1 CDP-alcohol phosphatidyltransferase family protein [Chloroflexota bacterium]MCI0843499.1 CDP-alcohol phosphatidyltransferase family protein [Chloroflexota bacterium]MCI0882913.1 CDP-alcohol phosphatidyltransferase family protein [Chloroflexota bacterium]